MDQLLRDTFARHEELVPVAHSGLRSAILTGARRRRVRRRWAWTGLLSALAVVATLLTGPVLALPHTTTPDVAAGHGPVRLLLVGIDRAGDDQYAEVRTDVIVLLQIDPEKRAAYAVVLPHDLLLNFPGLGRQRADGAYLLGGYQMAADAVTQLTGLALDGGAVVDLAATERITAAAGGVDLCIDRRVESRHLGRDGQSALGQDNPAVVYEPGCRHYDSREAVDYLREAIGRGDDDAVHKYLAAMGKAAVDPARLPAVLAAAGRGLELHLGAGSLSGVAGMMRRVDPGTLAAVRLPSTEALPGNADMPGREPLPDGDGLYDALRSGRMAPWLAAHPSYAA